MTFNCDARRWVSNKIPQQLGGVKSAWLFGQLNTIEKNADENNILIYQEICIYNRTMVAAANIVIMAAADGERISIFPLVCPDKAHSV